MTAWFPSYNVPQPALFQTDSRCNVFDMTIHRAIFLWPWKMVSASVCYLFYQPMDEKNKTWPLRFPAKENPNIERALFDWPIVLQYDVKAISRKFFGHEVFSAERSLNQPKARCVCIRSINQSNRFISVRLLFLFCSRVFISRSYENRSNLFILMQMKLKHIVSFLTSVYHDALWNNWSKLNDVWYRYMYKEHYVMLWYFL